MCLFCRKQYVDSVELRDKNNSNLKDNPENNIDSKIVENRISTQYI